MSTDILMLTLPVYTTTKTPKTHIAFVVGQDKSFVLPTALSSGLLQTEIALSTMKAEYVALSTSCKDLFPLLNLIHELAGACGLPVRKNTNLHVKVHEDNVGALTLGQLEPRRMTPRSKHYAIKYHWFRE
jgi:hypothetical protein